MKKCAEDIKFCDQPYVLRRYANAPLTRTELRTMPLMRGLQKIMLTLSPSTKTFTRLNEVIGSRRILLAAPARVQERDPKFVRRIGDFAVFKYWNKKKYQNTEYIVETDESKITGIMSKYDEKMPIMDLNNILFFKKQSNCPLASIYDVMNLPYARVTTNRVGPSASICPTLTMTCCANGSFRSFLVDSKIARFSLKAYWKNKFRLNMFLISGLVENFKLRPEDDYNTECQGTVKANKCQSLFLNIQRAVALAKKYEKNYRVDHAQCISLVEDIRNQLRCAACDPSNNKWINPESKKIIINRAMASKVVTKCFNNNLYEFKVLRPVFVAFLNYAHQVMPTLNISENIIWKIFPATVTKCSHWANYVQADDTADFSKSPDCMRYVYRILNSTAVKPSQVKFSIHLVEYFKKVIGGLINRNALEQMQTLLPDIVRPTMDPDMWEESKRRIDEGQKVHKAMLRREKSAAKKNFKKRFLQQKRVLMSEDQKKKSELAEKRISEGKHVNIKLGFEPKWHFIIDQSKTGGINLESYGNGGVEDLGLSYFFEDEVGLGVFLKSLAKERSG